MKRRSRILTLLGVIVILLIAIPIIKSGWTKHRIHLADEAFSQVQRGMTERDVATIMGQPEQIEVGESSAYWNDEPLSEEVREQVKRSYEYSINTFFLPITWTIGFDEHGTVISKHRLD